MSTATFLYIGLNAQRGQTRGKAFPEHTEGFMGVVTELDRFALLLDEWSNHDEALNLPYPGVFDYEITEEMGGWLYSNFSCTDDQFNAELIRLVAQWRF